MASSRQKQRIVWIEDKIWEKLLQMKGEKNNSEFIRYIINKFWREELNGEEK
jgi:predicted CopG family antitoxin